MSEVGKQWYVLRAMSGKENKVKEYIDAEIKNGSLGDLVSQVLIPTEKYYSIRNGKRVIKELESLVRWKNFRRILQRLLHLIQSVSL